MAMAAAEIIACIKEALPDASVELTDLAGDGDHYEVKVISARFAGKPRIEQHKMVYNALQGRMGGQLHALAVKTSIPT